MAMRRGVKPARWRAHAGCERLALRAGLLAAAVLATCAAPANAATVSVTGTGAKTLNFIEGAGMTEVQSNNGFMTYDGSYQVGDTVPIMDGDGAGAGGCAPAFSGGGLSFPFYFECPGAGVTLLSVDLGDLDDHFTLPGNDNTEGFPGGFGGTSPPATVTASIRGGPGNDSLGGGDEPDTFVEGHLPGPLTQPDPAASSGADLISGDDGSDTVDYSGRTTSVSVTVAADDANTGNDGETCPPPSQMGCEGDTVTVENATGGSVGDFLTGDAKANTMSGMGGGDTINIRNADAGDHAICGAGIDTVTADTAAQDLVDADCELVDYMGAPDTVIDSGPTGTTDDSTPTFTFHSTEPGSSFQCRFDAAAFAACSGPGASHTPTTPLADGPHTFEVRAVDIAGIQDPSPASQMFTVDTGGPPDTDPPETSITGGPADGSTISDNTPTFNFTADESSTFQCSLVPDGQPDSFGSCSDPGVSHTPAALPDGTYVFKVFATDLAGNPDPTPDSRTFTVDTSLPPDTTPPETFIDSGPSGTVATNDVSFTFHSSEDPQSSFECRLDSTDEGDFEDCTSPKDYIDLSEGVHTFEVRATDQSSNTDPSPASRTFTVDLSAPPPGSNPPVTGTQAPGSAAPLVAVKKKKCKKKRRAVKSKKKCRRKKR